MKLLFVLTALVFSVNVLAHGDHHIPGAIPPAPHGGVLGEAKHQHHGSHGHNHGKASKREIFFEGILKKGEVSLYPLELDPKTNKVFIPKEIKKFSEVKIKIEDPRKSKVVTEKFSATDKFWSVSLKGERGRRFMISVDAHYEGARYKAKIQVERK